MRRVLLIAGLLVCLPSLGAGQTATTPPPTPNLAQWRAHHDQLVATARALPAQASLADLLAPIMTLATTRGRAGAAAEETRAALLTVTFYVNGWPIAALVPEAKEWPAPTRRSISLRGRGDLAQHFTVSALLATMGGEPLAAMIGLYKELRDARGGSGFSFSDLAADRAGTRFGELASGTTGAGARLSARLTNRLTEDDFMPPVTGLPDNLPEAEFTKRFGGVGAPAYNALVAEIDRRIGALTLFR